MSRAPSCSKLLQEAQVVVEEQAQVGHAVAQHRDPLDAHPEREALDLLRIVAAVGHEAEHVGVDHPRAEDLDPARALAPRPTDRSRSMTAQPEPTGYALVS